MSQTNESSKSNDMDAQASQANGVTHQAKVVHQARGRTRIRLARESRDPGNMTNITQQLEAQDGIQEATANPQTGSVLVKYDHETHTHEGIMSILEDINVLAGVAVPEVSEGEEEGDKLSEAIKDLNTRIYRATGRRAHLGWIAFGGLTAAGIRQTIVYGVGLELIPGPVLLLAALEFYRRRNQMKPDVNDVQTARPA